MNTREILEAARDLIREPGGWCQKNPHDGDAHCAWGALVEIEASERPYYHRGSPTPALEALANQISGDWVPGEALGIVAVFNDHHTHAEVLELFNLAIADEIRKEDAHSRHMDEEAEREAAEDPAAPMVFA